MKNQSYVLPNTLAVTTLIVYVLCRLLVGLFPDSFFTIAESWFHGIALSKLDTWNLTVSSLILGIVSSTITAWVIGFIFVQVHNYFTKSK